MPFDGFNGEVAGNDYGSAFLIRRDHQVHLAALSYYSAPNSRIFKVLNVTKDEECTSLNHDSYYEFSPEDQIAVSFICNQYLMIIRVCMRPNLLLDMSRYADEATKFEVILEATNSHYKGEFNK